MLNFDMPMTLMVFFTLFGMMSLTVIVAAIAAKALNQVLEYLDRRQYSKAMAKMYRF